MIRQDDEQRRTQISERLRDVRGVQAALKKAARQAVQEHARAGRPIAVWRDNRVVWETPKPSEGDEGQG